jgi:UDP-2,3-diacylglucosamine pyrophosphatase LpxH
MRRALFVISDLHLGGNPATETSPDLEMCTPEARQRLARFIRYAAAQRREQEDVRLVINGDIVDFLAEEGATPFLGNDAQARKVLQNIMDRTNEVWTALRDFADSGAALTLLLGNHDIELSLPGPRRLLLERLGPGRVEFIYDNQAFVDGPVLIEHGNRYDPWNMVPHNRLRHVRAKLSRREEPRHYPNVPGSELVCKVVNRLKKKYRFVDLLKPETEAVLPALPALDPGPGGFLERVVSFILGAWPFIRSKFTRTDEHGRPKNDAEYTGGEQERIEQHPRTAAALRLAQDWEGILDPEETSFTQVDFDGLRELWDAAKEDHRRKLVEKLRQKWRHTSKTLRWSFGVNKEAPNWLVPAQASADAGFKVVVYGHTHLAKHVSLNGGATYLNTGTWVDLMRVPAAVLSDKQAAATAELENFLDDLLHNRLQRWRKLVPTFARIDLEKKDDRAELLSAGVHMFGEGGDPVQALPKRLLE